LKTLGCFAPQVTQCTDQGNVWRGRVRHEFTEYTVGSLSHAKFAIDEAGLAGIGSPENSNNLIKFEVFASQGRHVLIKLKFGLEKHTKGSLSHSKLGCYQ